jgi:hypothetical protein
MAKRTNRVAWGLTVGLVGGVVVPLMSGCHGRRSVPIQHGAAIAWKGGAVSVWDYSTDPGGYENQIEWVTSGGKRRVLARIGDVPADLEVLPDGRLEARFYDDASRTGGKLRLVILTWRSRDVPPIRIEQNG